MKQVIHSYKELPWKDFQRMKDDWSIIAVVCGVSEDEVLNCKLTDLPKVDLTFLNEEIEGKAITSYKEFELDLNLSELTAMKVLEYEEGSRRGDDPLKVMGLLIRPSGVPEEEFLD